MQKQKEESTSFVDQALLVSVYNGAQDLELCQEHLDELELLCETFGVDIVDKIPCAVRKITAATYISKGKLEQLVSRAKELGVNLIIIDEEISPAQQRNLEKEFQLTVMDRTEVILKVFEQRAQSHEARLQVELAELKYEAPRLKRMWTHLSRQAGSSGGAGAFLKGVGEKQIEIDKRLLQKRIDKLQSDLKEVRAQRQTQRAARKRSGIPTFALVGYTNAGKSTLMNALTDADVFVEDKLFATLDTTTRKFALENKQEVLLIDTVGFIRKLPHHLVAAFKSTLEEAVFADIIIHLVDVSHPAAEDQAKTTMKVLQELGAKDKQVITVLNKIDESEEKSMIQRLRIQYPHTVQISALHRTGFDELIDTMIEELRKQRREVVLRIPQSDYGLVSQIIEQGHVHHQDYDENDVILKVDLPIDLLGKLQKYVVPS